MSVEKLNELITTAPQFSQWWEHNRCQIQADLKRKRQLGVAIFMLSLLALLGAGVLFVVNTPQVVGPGFMGFTAMALGAVLMGVEPAVHYWQRWVGAWPKHTVRPLDKLINPADLLDSRGFEIDASAPLAQKNLLEKVLRHPNPDVRTHASSLLALKDVNMPNVWWRALEIVLEDIEEEAPTVSLTPEQQLDSVYVEIEKTYPIVSNAPPKVLRL